MRACHLLRSLIPALCISASLLSLGGCETQPKNLAGPPLGGPRGGALMTLAEVRIDGESFLAAPGAHALHIHDRAADIWRMREFSGSDAPTPPSIEALALDDESGGRIDEGRFLSWRDRLWWLQQPELDGRHTLLTSDDLGENWYVDVLPRAASTRPPSPMRVDGPSPYIASSTNALHLTQHADELYLVGSSAIWRRPSPSDSWEAIALSGVMEAGAPAADAFPRVIHSYLPRTPERDFEVLTLLSDQLLIYRRASPQAPWVLTSTLASVDRALMPSPDAERLFILTPDSLYQSDAMAEQWERTRLLNPDTINESCQQLLVAADENASAGYILLVGTNWGSIYRSEDGGQSWEATRSADPDRRGITDLHIDSDGTYWASTQGVGALRSRDGGRIWEAANSGLQATLPYTMARRGRDAILLGTNSGLYQADEAQNYTRWSQLSSRAVTSLLVQDTRLLGGTLGGSIIAIDPAGRLQTKEALVDRRAPLFQPYDKQRLGLAPIALLSLEHRAASQQYSAMSHRAGALVSLDGGAVWVAEDVHPVLYDALRGSHISETLLGPNQTRYLLTTPLDANARSQVWRSDDDGDVWRTVHTFDRHSTSIKILSMELLDPTNPEALLLARTDGLFRSRDGGRRWTPLKGPWQGAEILATTRRNDARLVLVKSQRSLDLYEVSSFDEDAEMTHYHISTPTTMGALDVLEMVATDRLVFLRTADRLWLAAPSERPAELTYNLTLLLSVILTLALGSVSFAIAKRFG